MGGVYLTSQRSIVFAELGATEYLVLSVIIIKCVRNAKLQ